MIPYFTPTETGLGWSSLSLDGRLCIRIEPRGLFKDDPTDGKRWVWWNLLSNGVKVAYGQCPDHREAVAAAVLAAKAKGLALSTLPQVPMY